MVNCKNTASGSCEIRIQGIKRSQDQILADSPRMTPWISREAWWERRKDRDCKIIVVLIGDLGQLGISNVATHHDSLSFARKDGGVSLGGYFRAGRRMDEPDMAFLVSFGWLFSSVFPAVSRGRFCILVLHDVIWFHQGLGCLGSCPLGVDMKDAWWTWEESLGHLMIVEYSESELLCTMKLSYWMMNLWLKDMEVLHDSLRVLDYLRFL